MLFNNKKNSINWNQFSFNYEFENNLIIKKLSCYLQLKNKWIILDASSISSIKNNQNDHSTIDIKVEQNNLNETSSFENSNSNEKSKDVYLK